MGDPDTSTLGLAPHLTKETISINEARRIVIQLSKPLADISQLIYDNLHVIERKMQMLTMTNESIEELSKNLLIPVIDLRETRFDQPRTVCTSNTCTTTYLVSFCIYLVLCIYNFFSA